MAAVIIQNCERISPFFVTRVELPESRLPCDWPTRIPTAWPNPIIGKKANPFTLNAIPDAVSSALPILPMKKRKNVQTSISKVYRIPLGNPNFTSFLKTLCSNALSSHATPQPLSAPKKRAMRMIALIVCAITVAIAAPVIPISGKPNFPNISKQSNTALHIKARKWTNIMVSVLPRPAKYPERALPHNGANAPQHEIAKYFTSSCRTAGS